jgi:hypothetical protein
MLICNIQRALPAAEKIGQVLRQAGLRTDALKK